MAKGLYRLRKPESKHAANQVPGRHELRATDAQGNRLIVTHEQAQEFDPKLEGLEEYVEAVAPATRLPGKP